MFYQEPTLQYEVRVEEPDPQFGKLLQQAIGGQEGEMRVALQYMFQAWALPPEYDEYRQLLMETAAEELGHIEMLATAVTKNLRGGEDMLADEAAQHPLSEGLVTGQNPRSLLSAGLSAMPVDSNGTPFTGDYVVASGHLAADLYANVMAESTGRLLATRLYELTDDPGMKEMLAYLIARDRMHQNQWLEALQSLDDPLPIPSSFPRDQEHEDVGYAFMSTAREPGADPELPWTQGSTPDGKEEFEFMAEQPGGNVPSVPAPVPMLHSDPNE